MSQALESLRAVLSGKPIGDYCTACNVPFQTNSMKASRTIHGITGLVGCRKCGHCMIVDGKTVRDLNRREVHCAKIDGIRNASEPFIKHLIG